AIGVGQTFWRPTLFVAGRDETDAQSLIERIKHRWNALYPLHFTIAAPWNQPARVEGSPASHSSRTEPERRTYCRHASSHPPQAIVPGVRPALPGNGIATRRLQAEHTAATYELRKRHAIGITSAACRRRQATRRSHRPAVAISHRK